MHTSSTPLWQDGMSQSPRQQLLNDIDVDVAIIGAGYTGLWTAYYLKQMNSKLSIAIIESEYVGFGGSGRNGGWCSAFLPMSLTEMAEQHGKDAMQFIQREMFATIAEIAKITELEGIDCDFYQGGTITSASSTAHIQRVKDYVAQWRASGFDESVIRWEGADEIETRMRTVKTYGGMYSPHCAVIHPWKLVQGIARVLEARGVTIYERSRVLNVQQRRVQTTCAAVNARWVVKAVESFASQQRRTKRSIVPLYSLMVATEPIPSHIWSEIGWSNRETFADGRNMVTYAQRTADNRIAFGGRGAPYHLGSRISPKFDVNEKIHDQLRETVRETFPLLGDVKFTHQWGGPIGASRDWHAFANVDHKTGLCSGGGYVGDGVALSNLIARTLVHQMLNNESPLTRSLLVNHRARAWELEPIRWIGINGLLKLTEIADARERRSGAPSSRIIAMRDSFLG